MKTRKLSVLTNNARGVFQSSVIRGALEVVGERGATLTVRELPNQLAPPAEVLEAVQDSSGALVLANVLTEAALTALWETGLPMTLVSHRSATLAIPAVLHDNRQGMSQLMGLLAADGRSRPVFVRGNPEQLDGIERERFYRDELMRHALVVSEESFIAGGFEPGFAGSSLQAFIAQSVGFDALVSSDYLMALEALEVLRSAGYAVPGAVSVVAYGDGPEAEAADLTVVAADVVELGRRAARQLLAQLAGQRFNGYTLLSTKLVRRGT